MWRREVEELEERRERARQLGGPERVNKHHARGKMTVHERIAALVDEGSFLERGMLSGVPTPPDPERGQPAGFAPCPFRMGVARIDGRRVAIHGDDFTVKGASVGRMYKAKRERFAQLSRELHLPVVRLVEGAGGSIKEILEIGFTELPAGNPGASQDEAEALSEVPVVAVGFGPMAGLSALFMVKSHFSVMVREQAQVFVAGPPLVRSALGQEITKEELGGYRIHTRFSGVVDNEAADEHDALSQARRFLSYLPANVWEMPPRWEPDDEPGRRDEELLSVVPQNPRATFDPRQILVHVLDHGSIFELGRYQGRSQVTALARLGGYPVGVLANDTRHGAGALDYDSAEKFQRFVDLCDTFHLPIVNFCDQPGLAIGRKSEEHGTIRKGIRATFAMTQATVGVATVYVRRCYGVAGAAQRPARRLAWQLAWPSARWGNIPVEGGVYAAHRKEIEKAPDPEARRRELEAAYRGVDDPFRTAEAFGVEDIIDPRETRPQLCEWVEMATDAEKRNLGPKRRGMRC
jgi:acetyl-CoA carboxylase carboxyltransferase component